MIADEKTKRKKNLGIGKPKYLYTDEFNGETVTLRFGLLLSLIVFHYVLACISGRARGMSNANKSSDTRYENMAMVCTCTIYM